MTDIQSAVTEDLNTSTAIVSTMPDKAKREQDVKAAIKAQAKTNKKYREILAIAVEDRSAEDTKFFTKERAIREKLEKTFRVVSLEYCDAKQVAGNKAMNTLIAVQKLSIHADFGNDLYNHEAEVARDISSQNIKQFVLPGIFASVFGLAMPDKKTSLQKLVTDYLASDKTKTVYTNPDQSATYLIRLASTAVRICLWADKGGAWVDRDNCPTQEMIINPSDSKISFATKADGNFKHTETSAVVEQVSYSELEKIVSNHYRTPNGNENLTAIQKNCQSIVDVLTDCMETGLPETAATAHSLKVMYNALMVNILKAHCKTPEVFGNFSEDELKDHGFDADGIAIVKNSNLFLKELTE